MATKETKPLISEKTKRILQGELQKVEQEVQEEAEVDKTVPGTKLDRYRQTARKVPFSKAYFEDSNRFKQVTIVPEENIPITIQGVKYELRTGVEITLPEPFAGEYFRWRASLRGHPVSKTQMEGVVFMQPGAGSLPPE